MADSSQVQISYVKQDSKGSVPTSSFQAVRHTGGSFGAPLETQRSNEIRGDAQRGAAVRAGLNPEAGIDMELSAKTFDDLIQGLLRSTWSTAAAVSDSSVIEASNTSSAFISSDDTTLDWTSKNITEGQWVFVDGFADDNINGWYKVTSISSTDLGVTPAPPSDDTNSEGNEITVEGSYIRNGTTDNYYALQAEFGDLTDKYRLISDCKIGSMDLSVDARSTVTGSFSFQGVSHELKTAKSGDGSVNAAPTTEILNTTDHVHGIYINGTKFEGAITSFSLSANMNPRRQNGVGKLTSEDVALGSLAASGNLSVYLTDSQWDNLLQKYIDFNKISIAIPFEDPDGNGYVFELPQIALTNEPGNIPGPDEDVMLDFDFEAEPGTIGNENKTIQVSRRQVT